MVSLRREYELALRLLSLSGFVVTGTPPHTTVRESYAPTAVRPSFIGLLVHYYQIVTACSVGDSWQTRTADNYNVNVVLYHLS